MMIEKLPFTECHSGGGEHMVDILKLEPVQPFQMQHKINELVDAVNSIVSVQEKLIDSRFVVETENTETAFIKTMRMDKEFAEEEMERLQKENSDLKDEVGKLQKQLAEWQNANISLIKDSAICNTYTHIRWDELCRLREIADKYAEITGHKGVQND